MGGSVIVIFDGQPQRNADAEEREVDERPSGGDGEGGRGKDRGGDEQIFRATLDEHSRRDRGEEMDEVGRDAALVARLCNEQGITVVLVAHDVNPILPYLDRVVYLGRGGAVSGTPEEVITSETLSRLYVTPIEVLHTSDGRLVVVGQPEAPAHHHDRHLL